MTKTSINKSDVALWGVVGALVVAFAPMGKPIRDYANTLIESRASAVSSHIELSELRAEHAQPAMNRKLETAELDELRKGYVLLLNGREADASAILGKYALLGNLGAQGAIGGMFYSGKGLPVDRAEGIRWLRLAAQQGGLVERQELAAALAGTLRWENSDSEEEIARAPLALQQSQFQPIPPVRSGSHMAPNDFIYRGDTGQTGDQAYGTQEESRSNSIALSDTSRTALQSPTILNRAGPGTYTDEYGDIYTQAGPHGVVNTRTGEFSPTN